MRKAEKTECSKDCEQIVWKIRNFNVKTVKRGSGVMLCVTGVHVELSKDRCIRLRLGITDEDKVYNENEK